MLLSLRLKSLAVVWALLGCSAASANNFKGYFTPAVLISPMKDNITYTPVGMGIVTSKAGFRVHPVTGRGDFHSGVDLGANLNDRVYCLLDGIVTKVGWRGNLGCAVEVYHPYPNVRTIVGHLNAYSVTPGMFVRRGRVIGYAGTTGRSTGVHVHYTVIREDTNEYIEPLQFIRQVPNYVAQLHTAQAKIAMNQNMKNFQKFDTKLVDSANNDLPEGKKGDEKPPPASIEP
jgi:murein DD-endopeptidase MepM/ murein hydrolase activator NlpD